MSGVVIKPPNMQKLLVEQRDINASLSVPPGHSMAYLSSAPAALSSVYHSRGSVAALALEDRAATADSAAAAPPLLGALLNAPPRVQLELEKSLDLTCRALERARAATPEMSAKAKRQLARIVEMGSQCAGEVSPSE